MKKLCAILSAILLLVTCLLQVSASVRYMPYEIDELGLTLSLPIEYDIFTRDMDPDSPFFAKSGISYEDFMDSSYSEEYYVAAFWDDWYNEFFVYYSPDSAWISDLNLCTTDELTDYLQEYVSGLAEAGYDVLEQSIYYHSQAKFIRILFREPEENVYVLMYTTCYNDQSLDFIFFSYYSDFTATDLDEASHIIDSVTFNTAPQLPSAAETTVPEVTQAPEVTQPTVPHSDSSADKNLSLIIIGIVVVLLLIILVVVLLLVFQNRKRTHAVDGPQYFYRDTYQAPPKAPSIEPSGSVKPAPKFCRECGAPLLEDSRFCQKCGTEIKR